MRLLVAIMAVAVVSYSASAAESQGKTAMRCQTKLVMLGDSSLEVLQKCGEPDSKETLGVIEIDGEFVNVSRYAYQPGKGLFLKILEFHNGKLFSVVDGPRQ